MPWRDGDGLRWLEVELPGARAAFTSRVGGASEGPYASLNLSAHTGDEPAQVDENRRRLAAALGLEDKEIRVARQVHGVEILRHGAEGNPGGFPAAEAGLPEADGHVTNGRGAALCVLVADCLPVALSGPGGLALLHCGWRGLAAGIIERGVEAVAARAAAIGPGICPEHYEVGEEVLAAFEQLGEDVADGAHLDLAAVAERQLLDAGVSTIESSGLCTFEEDDLLYSHRRDGAATGRQAGIAWIT